MPPAAQLIRSHEERVRIFREIPKDYIRSRLDRAEAYAEERDMSISDVLLNWWLYDREAVEA